MRVLHLSWEYPPRVFGGLGRHVDALTAAQTAAGVDVDVVTLAHPDAPDVATAGRLRVVRVAEPTACGPPEDWFATVTAAAAGLAAAAVRVGDERRPDVVHAHDWLVAHAATATARTLDVPLVATVHATERGRHQGWLPGPLSRAIDAVERELVHAAQAVVTCSDTMRRGVIEAFAAPRERVHLLANGVDVEEFSTVPSRVRSRMRARFPDGSLLVYAGRLEYEKGVQTLLRALARLRRSGRAAHLAVAGDGTHAAALREEARTLRLDDAVTFLGFLGRRDLAALLGVADAVAVPSLYEPFGIVALEAMAAGAPLVAAETGGLAEVVEHGVHGLLFAPGDVDALTGALRRTLDLPAAAARRARAAADVVAAYRWDAVAAGTSEVYARAVELHSRTRDADEPALR